MTIDQISPSLTRSWIDACRKKGYFVKEAPPTPEGYEPSPTVKQMLCGIKQSRQGVKRGTVYCERCTGRDIRKRAIYKFNEGNGVFSFFCCECRADMLEGADAQTRARFHSL